MAPARWFSSEICVNLRLFAAPVCQRGIRVTILLIVLVSAANRVAAGPTDSASADDPFARHSWNIELAAQVELEAWNYNTNHEELYGLITGLTYGLGKGVVITAAAPLTYVAQRGVDGLLLGGTIGVRGRVYRRARLSIYWEFSVGASQADTFVPPRGTRFNYIAQGGGGATLRVARGLHALAAVRWIHLSNNGLAGRDRNPDIEAIGAHVGVLMSF
jgi:Lipid A 3-O-deacylase (PagL)